MGRAVRVGRPPGRGQLVASGRIPIQAMLAAVEAEDSEALEADEDSDEKGE